MAKSEKLYKDSPSIKKDEDGKPGISKPSDADGESMGVDGNPLPGSDGKMPVTAEHDAERSSMHKRHEEEQKSMHERHGKDMKEMHKRHEKAGKASEKTGEDANVEGTK